MSPFPRLLLALLLAAGLAWPDDAKRLFKMARRAERQGNDVEAFLLYSKARAQSPSNRRYFRAVNAVRQRAAQTLAGLGNLQAASAVDPSNGYLRANLAGPPAPLSATLPQMEAARALRPPVELEPERKIASFKLKSSMESVYKQVADEFGLNVIFDSDFETAKEIRFVLEEANFATTIIALDDVAKAFIVPVSSKIFLVAADTPQKRAELEPVATAVVPLADALGAQETQELGQAVQQALDIKRLQIDATRQQVLVRDTVTRVRLAQALYQHLAKPRGEVMIHIDLITIDDTSELNAGLTLPTSFPITNFSTVLRNAPPQPDASAPLLGIGGGGTVFGIAIGSAAAVANKLKTVGEVRSRFSLRSADGFPADLHVGERFPIINARFSASVITDEIEDSIEDGTFREPFPSFTFEDLGLVFKVTPRIHSAREISLEMEAEIKQLTGRSVNEVPILSSRRMQSFARLRAGEVAVITGMSLVEERRTNSGLAFLAEIPWLGRIFRRNFRQFNRSHLLLLITPRIVRLPPAEMAPSLTLRYGPEARPLPAL